MGVEEKIQKAVQRVNRDREDVQLIVVSKGQPYQVNQSAIDAGVTRFGENYPEESLEKIKELSGAGGIQWHMIGHLQSRKSKIVSGYFSMLHSLDSVKLAIKLNEELKKTQKCLPCLLEVNVSGEANKYGFHADVEGSWDELIPEIEIILGLKNIQMQGLMTMPPLFDQPEQVRPYFAKTRRLLDYLNSQVPGLNWKHLSMGTSGDFIPAIEEGATYVRIGTAILGPRYT